MVVKNRQSLRLGMAGLGATNYSGVRAAIPIHVLRARLIEAKAARRSAEQALAAARAREAAIAAPQEPRERLDAVRADLAAVHHRQAQHEAAAVAARHELVVCGAQRAQIAEFLSELDLWPRYTMLDER